MRFNVAILSVPAEKPEQRVAIEDVSREVKRMIATGDPAAHLIRSSEIGDADVFQSGWISINDAGLRITDEGLSLWRSLNGSDIAASERSSSGRPSKRTSTCTTALTARNLHDLTLLRTNFPLDCER